MGEVWIFSGTAHYFFTALLQPFPGFSNSRSKEGANIWKILHRCYLQCQTMVINTVEPRYLELYFLFPLRIWDNKLQVLTCKYVSTNLHVKNVETLSSDGNIVCCVITISKSCVQHFGIILLPFSNDTTWSPLDDTKHPVLALMFLLKCFSISFLIRILVCNDFSGSQIMEFVKESHYQLACTRYYELTHGVLFSRICDPLLETYAWKYFKGAQSWYFE